MGVSEKKSKFVQHYKELDIYERAMTLAMDIFEVSKVFPNEERYSLTDQIRRSSRSICANIAEAWRKRRYKDAFISKLSDVETEACEVQVWAEIALRCGYIDMTTAQKWDKACDRIMAQIVLMIQKADQWVINP
jgi:four helix bundle protein